MQYFKNKLTAWLLGLAYIRLRLGHPKPFSLVPTWVLEHVLLATYRMTPEQLGRVAHANQPLADFLPRSAEELNRRRSRASTPK